MVFIPWFQFGFYLFMAVWIGACALAIWGVRDTKLWYRIPVTLFLALLALPACGMLALSISCHETMPPIYSPDRKMAVRIESFNGEPFSGSTSVMLYSDHGLTVKELLHAGFGLVAQDRVRWTSDTEVSIVSEDGILERDCTVTNRVSKCVDVQKQNLAPAPLRHD